MDRYSKHLRTLCPECPSSVKVAQLLRLLLAAELRAVTRGQIERRSLIAWSAEVLQAQLQQGRTGVSDAAIQPVPPLEEASTAVLDAFRDGLVLLFVDERRATQLEETVQITDETVITLIRRIMLRG